MTSSASYIPLPGEAVVEVRRRTYLNSKAEEETVTAVDRAATEAVAKHEGFMVQQAQAIVETVAETHRQLEQVQDGLAEITGRARRGEPFDLQEFIRLDDEAQQLIEEVRRFPGRTTAILDSLADPMKSTDELLSKYPQIQRPTKLLG
jgi:hypothetical protein